MSSDQKEAASVRVFNAIEHAEYGNPTSVLRLVERPMSEVEPGPHDALVRVSKRPIHPGDLLMIAGDKRGGRATPIPAGAPRTPGFEGVGVIEKLGSNAAHQGQFAVGQRVMFLSGTGRTWATYSKVPVATLVAVPDEVSDAVAAQFLINTMTAQVVLHAGHNALPVPELPVTVIQTAAGSSVMRIVTAFGQKIGLTMIRLVRTKEGAALLEASLPGAPVIATETSEWKEQVRSAIGSSPVHVIFDAVGGAMVDDLVSFLSDGGTFVNFGWLSKGASDLSEFAPRGLAFKGVVFTKWMNFSLEEQKQHRDTAIQLAKEAPHVFAIAGEYPLADFRKAIDHASGPRKSGMVLLTS
ncbi:zinc-binding dehydrogenase [Paraburkholderia elongata]|uniref:Zinc-binding dehydrogenase n=1 Tax=Paraburkholderia elongata TaxID=2675747 RepID=A0A972NVT3_9BURK|nr:zinc-binding dehydrogenase [Paraburkholderia elongata]NPT59299.1 zinc-binding dehydrogenase [Paraburkholderia elongata]